jgi:murein DD-endopeptidase MepM/ murein hydrolase activator NlpD
MLSCSPFRPTLVPVTIALAILTLVPATPLSAAKRCKTMVCVEATLSGSKVSFHAHNRHAHTPVTIRLELDKTDKPASIILRPGEQRRFNRKLKRKKRKLAFRYWWKPGVSTATHDDSVLYRLPWARKQTRQISQGCNSSKSHTGESRFAIDIDMPVGTPVHAARAGTVIKLKEDSDENGSTEDFLDKANFVDVLHADDTIATYAHLKRNGVRVRLGERVRVGDVLGYSGNTGYSTGPHLHFAVLSITDKLDDYSIKVRFRTIGGSVSCPADGTRLTAY